MEQQIEFGEWKLKHNSKSEKKLKWREGQKIELITLKTDKKYKKQKKNDEIFSKQLTKTNESTGIIWERKSKFLEKTLQDWKS